MLCTYILTYYSTFVDSFFFPHRTLNVTTLSVRMIQYRKLR